MPRVRRDPNPAPAGPPRRSHVMEKKPRLGRGLDALLSSDLNPIEKAQGFKDYLDRFKMTHDQLAARLGLGRPTISNLVSLLDLAAEVQDLVRIGQLSTGHAKILKGVADHEKQVAIAKEV